MGNISIFELLFFAFVAFAWPISITRMIKRRSTKGKGIIFSLIVLLGYVFGIIHKLFYDFDFVIYIYFLDTALVLVDLSVFFYIRHKYERGEN